MSVCVNHPERNATARCSSCHKPICGDCVVQDGGSVFCSQKCAEGAARFYARYKPDRGPGLFTKLKNVVVSLVALAILIAAAVAVCAYVFKIPFFVNLLKKYGL